VKLLNDFYIAFVAADEAILLRLMRTLTAVAIMIYLGIYLMLGSSAHWIVPDNLDSNFVAYKILIESGALFASNGTIIDQPLGGIPRSTMASEFDVLVWLYMLFGPEGAYILNRILMTIVGFIGMHQLLRRHIIKEDGDEIVRMGVSLCFALLPFWPLGGLSVAGMPLALSAMLEIRNRNHSWWNWVIVVLYPFYSSLILSGFFFLVLVTVIWLYDLASRKRVLSLFGAIVVMSLFYVLTHYRLFIEFLLDTSFISHRLEFKPFYQSSLKEAVKESFDYFIGGQLAHAPSLHRYFIMPLTVISIFLMLPRSKIDQNRLLYWQIMIALCSIAMFAGFKNFPIVSTIMASIWNVMPMQFDRFYFLSPLLWMLSFSLVLSTLRQHSSSLGLLIIAVVVLQLGYTFRHHEVFYFRNSPSISQYFAKEQFADIKEHIGKPLNTYRVASLGIDPSVSLYNGFYTIDGYFANYPLSYKYAFREIIANELEKDFKLKQYFDDWGSRVYLFNTQTGQDMMISAGSERKLQELRLDWNAFYDLGGRYLFSAVEIDIQTNPSLIYEGKFEDLSSAWDIYLYRVTSI
jgi:hypothetical protein